MKTQQNWIKRMLGGDGPEENAELLKRMSEDGDNLNGIAEALDCKSDGCGCMKTVEAGAR